ncbi:hypothetical protein AX14_004559 [Amanita brunnescens Koide BX004]|nr:hypothetical protein AX14_004559 [Amanita brunnescens Koide BX004]
MAGDYSAAPDDGAGNDDSFTKVLRGKKQKRVTFPSGEGIARIDEVHDDWDNEDKREGSISPITYIDQVIASHAPAHMKDSSVKTKSKHVQDEVSCIKKRLEDFKATSQRTRESDNRGKAERASSPVVIDLVTLENQTTSEEHRAGSPEVPLL